MVFVSVRRAALIALGLAALAASGCEEKKVAPPSNGGAPADAMTIPPAASGVVSAHPGCEAVVQGGAKLAGMLDPGVVSVAVLKGKALIVNTIFKQAGPSGDGGAADAVETANASRTILSAVTGALESKPEPITEPHPKDEPAGSPLTWGIATTFGDELSTLSLGTTRSGARGCGGGTVMLKGAGAGEGKAIAGGHCHFSTTLAGGARGDVAIAVTDGIVDPAKGSVPAVDAIVFSAGKAKPVRLESFAVPGTAATERPKVDALAAAASAGSVAAAFRVTRGAVQELHVVKLAPDGKQEGKVEVIDRGVIGAPALAFEGDTLHLVWATRASEKDAYSLHWTKWAKGGAPQAHQRLGTGVVSAYSPSLAIDGSRFLLAWTEGDKLGVVKAGASNSGLTGALALAGVISNAGIDAKTPRVALDRGSMFIVWEELAEKTKELRASPIRCQE